MPITRLNWGGKKSLVSVLLFCLFALAVASASPITLISPANGENSSTGNITFYFNLTDFTVWDNCSLFTNQAGVWARVATKAPMQNDENFTQQIPDQTGILWGIGCQPLGQPAEGPLTWSENRTLAADTILPVFVASNLNETGSASGEIYLAVNATDATTGIQSVQAELEQVILDPGWPGEPSRGGTGFGWVDLQFNANETNYPGLWYGRINTAGVQDGAYVIAFKVIDFARNQQYSYTRFISVDNTNPSATINYNASGEIVPAGSWRNISGPYFLAANISDLSSGVANASMELVRNGAAIISMPLNRVWNGSTPTDLWLAYLNTTSLDDGIYTVSLRAYDYAGNVNDSEWMQMSIGNQKQGTVAANDGSSGGGGGGSMMSVPPKPACNVTCPAGQALDTKTCTCVAQTNPQVGPPVPEETAGALTRPACADGETFDEAANECKKNAVSDGVGITGRFLAGLDNEILLALAAVAFGIVSYAICRKTKAKQKGSGKKKRK